MRIDGVRIADNYADLGSIEAQIVIDEFGAEIPVSGCHPSNRVWTYTYSDGRPETIDAHCNSWLSSSPTDTGVGNDLCASMALNWSASCDTAQRLFCFEQ